MFTFKNCTYLADSWTLQKGDVAFDGGRIVYAGPGGAGGAGDFADASEWVIVPGFLDIHIHGAFGIDIMSASVDDLALLAQKLPSFGVTGFFPTTVAADTERTLAAIRNVRLAAETGGPGTAVAGIHIEGPFVSREKKGAFDPAMLRGPDCAEFDRFAAEAKGLRLRITAAPELEGACAFFRHVREKGGLVTIGHTNATQAVAMQGLEAGATCFTHLFNAMSGLHHREPGVAGAALLSDAYAELICDGMHVVPDMVDLVFRTKDHDKLVLISDAILAAGLGDGDYHFWNFHIAVKDGLAREDSGTIAGSTLTLAKAVSNVQKFAGLGFEQAVKCASLIPARAVGLDRELGSITPGKRADLLVLDKNRELLKTYCGGREAYSRL